MVQKEVLETYYYSGKSMKDISKILGFSEHKIVYWMKKHNIKRRTLSEAIYLHSNPNGDPFKLKVIKDIEDAKLFGLGIGIYWGEGEKTTRHALRVANSDVNVILTFRRFLRIICGVQEQKIGYSLICFNDSNINEVSNYWSKALGTTKEKFGKIVQIPTQGKGTYKRKSLYGVCIIYVSNIKLKAWVLNQIKTPN